MLNQPLGLPKHGHGIHALRRISGFHRFAQFVVDLSLVGWRTLFGCAFLEELQDIPIELDIDPNFDSHPVAGPDVMPLGLRDRPRALGQPEFRRHVLTSLILFSFHNVSQLPCWQLGRG